MFRLFPVLTVFLVCPSCPPSLSYADLHQQSLVLTDQFCFVQSRLPLCDGVLPKTHLSSSLGFAQLCIIYVLIDYIGVTSLNYSSYLPNTSVIDSAEPLNEVSTLGSLARLGPTFVKLLKELYK